MTFENLKRRTIAFILHSIAGFPCGFRAGWFSSEQSEYLTYLPGHSGLIGCKVSNSSVELRKLRYGPGKTMHANTIYASLTPAEQGLRLAFNAAWVPHQQHISGEADAYMSLAIRLLNQLASPLPTAVPVRQPQGYNESTGAASIMSLIPTVKPRSTQGKRVASQETEQAGWHIGKAIDSQPLPKTIMSEHQRSTPAQALQQVREEIAARGIEVLSDADPEIKRYLDDAAQRMGVPPEKLLAITIGSIILVRDTHQHDVRTLREELIHIDQQAAGRVEIGADGHDTRDALELEAREKLLEQAEQWGLTDEQIDEIKAEIKRIHNSGYY